MLADPLAVTLGSEPVRVDGEIVGRVTSGGHGFRVDRSIAFAYLPADHADLGRAVEVEVFGEWIGAEVVRDPVYDPEGLRVRVKGSTSRGLSPSGPNGTSTAVSWGCSRPK